MKNIRMVVTDLDGTLLRTDKSVSQFTLDVINKIRQKGILFVLATARPVRAVKEYLPFLKCDAGIFHSGAVIYNRDERIGGIGIENPVRIVQNILKDMPAHRISVEANDMLYANFNANEIWQGTEHIRTNDFSELYNVTADKIIAEAHSLKEMNEFIKYISPDLYLQLSENKIAMIMNKQATKINGILRLAKDYGISVNEVVAFGDDYNDIDMLKFCGTGIAVSNALNEVKCNADEICDENDNDGVAKWLNDNIIL